MQTEKVKGCHTKTVLPSSPFTVGLENQDQHPSSILTNDWQSVNKIENPPIDYNSNVISPTATVQNQARPAPKTGLGTM